MEIVFIEEKIKENEIKIDFKNPNVEEEVHDDIKVIKEIFQEMSDIVEEKEINYT